MMEMRGNPWEKLLFGGQMLEDPGIGEGGTMALAGSLALPVGLDLQP